LKDYILVSETRCDAYRLLKHKEIDGVVGCNELEKYYK
jgi:hypothetical protein